MNILMFGKKKIERSLFIKFRDKHSLAQRRPDFNR